MIHFRNSVIHLFPMIAHWGNLLAVGSAASLACGIAIACAFPVASFLPYGTLYPILQISAIVCIISGVIVAKKRISFPLFFCAGYLFYSAQSVQTQHNVKQIAAVESSVMTISGTILTPPAPWKGKFKFLLLINTVDGVPDSPFKGKTFLCTGNEFPAGAHELVLEGSVLPGAQRKNRYEYDEYAFFQANGITGRIDVKHIVKQVPPASIGATAAFQFRQWLGSVLKLYRNPDHRALIRASFTGEKEYIAQEITAAFTQSGLIHILALSGFNVAIMLAAVYFILAILPIGGMVKHIVALVVLWIYFCFIGPIPSFTRAVIMATLVILSVMLQRKNYSLQTLGIAAICWLVFSPSSLFQPGFQLSYGATFGILTLYPLLLRIYPGFKNPLVEYVARFLFSSLAVSVAAFCTTLPIMLYHFGSVSLYGIVANIIAIPLMTGAMWSFFAALLIHPFVPLLSSMMIFCSGGMTDALLAVAMFSGRIPALFFVLPAPYPELIIIYYLFLIMLVTAEVRMVLKAAAIIIPLLLCIVPADYLLRRYFAATEIVVFSSNPDVSVLAIRFPNGGASIICKGATGAVRYVLKRTAEPWIRHNPGTSVCRICMFDRYHQCIDSNVVSGKCRVSNADTVKLTELGNRKNHVVCRYMLGLNQIIVSFLNDTINIALNKDNTCRIWNGKEDSCVQRTLLPLKIIMKPGKYSVQSYE